jgi:hypothetical protein
MNSLHLVTLLENLSKKLLIAYNEFKSITHSRGGYNMEKFGKGNKHSSKTDAVPEHEGALKDAGKGSMNYTEVMEKFEREDTAKIQRGKNKDLRYGE